MRISIRIKGKRMTLALLEQLEGKIQNAIDTIALLQMEVEELKADKQEVAEKSGRLEAENIKLTEEHQLWQARLSTLLGKIDKVEDTL